MINQCAECESTNIKVINSRIKNDIVWRRRRCLKCRHTFTTFEISEKDWKTKLAIESDMIESFGKYYERLSAKEQIDLLDKLAG